MRDRILRSHTTSRCPMSEAIVSYFSSRNENEQNQEPTLSHFIQNLNFKNEITIFNLNF